LLLSRPSSPQTGQTTRRSSATLAHPHPRVHERHRHGESEVLRADVPRKHPRADAAVPACTCQLLAGPTDPHGPVDSHSPEGSVQPQAIQRGKESRRVHHPAEDAGHPIKIAVKGAGHLHPQKSHQPQSRHLAGNPHFQAEEHLLTGK
jgi:hypothetical protein